MKQAEKKPYVDKILTSSDVGENVPRRSGKIAPKFSNKLLKLLGWKTKGAIPNVSQAVCIAVPHTSNLDALYTLPCLFDLAFDLKIIGKKSLFKNPIMSKFMTYSGVIPIDRGKKGSVIQATIDEFKKGNPLFLGIAPEGTRGYTKEWRSGFYHIALGAGVPIIPIAMDYKSKEIRIMNPVYVTGDYEKDLADILQMYKDVHPKRMEGLSQALKDINNW